MPRFVSIREAKDYLAGRIAAEAEQEGTPLSEVERKMLYFSETDWTLPDMTEISAEFDRDYDQNEYEQKIAGLVSGIDGREGSHTEQKQDAWDEAMLRLSEGDHYLLVLINSTPTHIGNTARPPHDRLKLMLTALVCFAALVAVLALLHRLGVLNK